MGRSAAWSAVDAPPGDAGAWISLDLGLEIYNASDNASETTPDQNHLRWSRLPEGWQIKPQEAAARCWKRITFCRRRSAKNSISIA